MRRLYVLLYESAEEFAELDPFVTGGVAARRRVRDWNEALT